MPIFFDRLDRTYIVMSDTYKNFTLSFSVFYLKISLFRLVFSIYVFFGVLIQLVNLTTPRYRGRWVVYHSIDIVAFTFRFYFIEIELVFNVLNLDTISKIMDWMDVRILRKKYAFRGKRPCRDINYDPSISDRKIVSKLSG